MYMYTSHTYVLFLHVHMQRSLLLLLQHTHIHTLFVYLHNPKHLKWINANDSNSRTNGGHISKASVTPTTLLVIASLRMDARTPGELS